MDDHAPLRRPSTRHLLEEVIRQTAALFRLETRLLGAELRENAAKARLAAILLVAGLVGLLPAVLILLMAMAMWLVRLGLPPDAAYAVVGLMTVLLASILIFAGVRSISTATLLPTRSMGQLRATMRSTE